MQTKVIGADRIERWIRAFDKSIERARKQQESNHRIRKTRERRKNNAKLKRVG